jgi:tetratricopeptide (TPR) repeat protein
MIQHYKKLLLLCTVTAVFSCDGSHKIIPAFNITTPAAPTAISSEKSNDDASNASVTFKNGDYAKSAILYEKILHENPSDQDSVFYYAESLRMSGQPTKALSQYEKISQNSLAALEGSGLAYLQAGEVEKALGQFNIIIRQDVSRWRTINAIGVINAINGKNEEAMKYYKMALEISRDNPAIMNNIALGIGFGGDQEQAISILKRAIDLMPGGGVKKQRLENNLALLYGISGKMDEAEQILRKSMPEAAVYNNLGYYATLSADKQLAWSYLSKAITANPVYYEKAENNMKEVAEEPIPSEKMADPQNQINKENMENIPKSANLKAKRGSHKLPLPSFRQ